MILIRYKPEKNNFNNKGYVEFKEKYLSEENILYTDNILNFDQLLKKKFSLYKDKTVFISYSHKDALLACNIAKEIETKTSYKCFVDCMLWDSIYKIERDIIETANTDINNVKKVLSWTNVSLSSQLVSQLFNSSYFIFIDTENSVVDGKINKADTRSPWLFLENQIANCLSNNLPLNESLNIEARFNLDFNNFIQCNSIEDIVNVFEQN